MKLNTTLVLTTFDGKALKDDAGDVTLGRVAVNALLAPYQDEANLSGEEKFKRFMLASRLHEAALPVEVTVEEAALLKKLIAKGYAPMVMGRAWQAIDNPPNGDARE